jgi:ABC-2 type transport system permease protein
VKLLSVVRKSLREQRREILALTLTLVTAPFFVFLYWLLFPSGSTTYALLVLNRDAGAQLADGSTLAGGNQLAEAIKAVTYANGRPILDVTPVADRADAETRLRDRSAAALIVIPENFSRAIRASLEQQEPVTASVVMVGDLTYPQYSVAAVIANAALDQYVQTATGRPHPIQVMEQPLGASAARTEFENYVPGLLIFSVVMLVFQASMAIAREVEAGTLRRLQLTRMTSLDFLGGITVVHVLIGVAAVALTFLTAWALGFRSQGPLWVAFIVAAMTSLSIVGVGLLVACFSRTVTEAFLIANFPLVLLMFFSGSIFPIPRVPLFTIGERVIGLYDVLPPTHAVVALNKVLTLGAGLQDVAYELVAVVVLSITYFAIGVWLFNRSRMKAR